MELIELINKSINCLDVKTQTRLSELCGVSQTTIWKLATGKTKKVSAELAVKIEKATKGSVTRFDLRPDFPWSD